MIHRNRQGRGDILTAILLGGAMLGPQLYIANKCGKLDAPKAWAAKKYDKIFPELKEGEAAVMVGDYRLVLMKNGDIMFDRDGTNFNFAEGSEVKLDRLEGIVEDGKLAYSVFKGIRQLRGMYESQREGQDASRGYDYGERRGMSTSANSGRNDMVNDRT